MTEEEPKIKIHAFSDEAPQEPVTEEEEGQLALDILNLEDKIIILAPIAGVKEEHISLSITDDVLTIRGKRKAKYNLPEEDFYTKECFWGNFSRSIVLPLNADSSKIEANFEDNVLEIIIGKKEEGEKTKVIKIKKNED
ncbi:Hsp20/alpha crystallin family protein [Patescibacteria group bacterium]|nr:Hsp20/alpha crystallin family protein [Patescibacteria group bacterium]